MAATTVITAITAIILTPNFIRIRIRKGKRRRRRGIFILIIIFILALILIFILIVIETLIIFDVLFNYYSELYKTDKILIIIL